MIKKAVKSALKLFNPLFKKLGYQPFVANQDLVHFFATIKKMGFEPKHIVDVGANHGGWTTEALKYFPNSYYTLLEPQKSLENFMKDLLANPKIKLHTVGAGSQTGKLKLTIGALDYESTFRYSENDAREKGLSQVEVPVVTLNELLRNTSLPTPEIIKIDAEGFDIEVLKGSSDFFGKTEIFLVEVGIGIEDIENSFLKTINWMDDKGYKLFEITHLNRWGLFGVLGLAELCFIKKNGFIDSRRKY
jgi:FkbM family methyltransferase